MYDIVTVTLRFSHGFSTKCIGYYTKCIGAVMQSDPMGTDSLIGDQYTSYCH